MKKCLVVTGVALLSLSSVGSVHAVNAVDELLAEYSSPGNFSAQAGKTLWSQKFIDAKTGDTRQCTTCHTNDLRKDGKHARTGKVIKPLAPSVNPERLTDINKIRKWLKRNCKWTLGRECNSQEKGDILTFIQTQ